MNATWGARARAYGALVREHPLLPTVAKRLVDLVPMDAGVVLDVGGGTGLVSEHLLARTPAPCVHLCDPTPEMVAIARERLGARLASARELGAEEVDQDPTPVDAVTASACLHLAQLPRALAAIAARLRSDGILTFNLWWHAWAPTAGDSEDDVLWRAPLAHALEEAGHDPGHVPPPKARAAPLTPAALGSAARNAGFDLDILAPDQDPMTAAFLLDFAAMDPDLLKDIPDPTAVLARARELATGEARTTSTRFRLRRRR